MLDYVVQGLLKRGHARVLTEVVVSLKTKVANASRCPSKISAMKRDGSRPV